MMPLINNIFNIKVVSVSGSSSVNIGNTLNLNPTSSEKSVGDSVSPIGDFTKTGSLMTAKKNSAIDPDFLDQS